MATGRIPTTANSPLTVKGDLFGYSTTQARVPVGNDGETLVADSSTTTGLRYGANFAAGKNKIINGDFTINQRGFTSNTTTLSFNFDRWFQSNGGTTGTLTVTPQTFTPGAAPIAGYEGSTFLQGITASGASADTVAVFQHKIEDVRTLAGQTMTFSFFARATTGTPKIGLEISQNFGTGGSPSATVMTSLGAVTISTSWARYSLTLAVPSISGKTLGTTNNSFLAANLWLSAGSDNATRASSIGLQNNTFQIWGVQVEAGSVATAFQTATGTLQGELAACQRYYYRTSTPNAANGYISPAGVAATTGRFDVSLNAPVTMRVGATSIDYANLQVRTAAGSAKTITSATLDAVSTTNAQVRWGAATFTVGEVAFLETTTTGGYWGLSAEL
jgi:hypothetical protein